MTDVEAPMQDPKFCGLHSRNYDRSSYQHGILGARCSGNPRAISGSKGQQARGVQSPPVLGRQVTVLIQSGLEMRLQNRSR